MSGFSTAATEVLLTGCGEAAEAIRLARWVADITKSFT
jgi:hypothetical protein